MMDDLDISKFSEYIPQTGDIILTYEDVNDRKTIRPIIPKQSDSEMLLAFSVVQNADRHFRWDRIIKIEKDGVELSQADIEKMLNPKSSIAGFNFAPYGKPFQNSAFFFTGYFSKVRRKDMQEIAEALGGTFVKYINFFVESYPNKKVFLVTNTPNSESDKNEAADKLHITKISENEFIHMVELSGLNIKDMNLKPPPTYMPPLPPTKEETELEQLLKFEIDMKAHRELIARNEKERTHYNIGDRVTVHGGLEKRYIRPGIIANPPENFTGGLGDTYWVKYDDSNYAQVDYRIIERNYSEILADKALIE
ncbi:hypothetical protein FACS189485_02130 [Spirochaetia bacterium]|nr:hypothetical protein FACS189485_02130 [Spirochaetia bacterium]